MLLPPLAAPWTEAEACEIVCASSPVPQRAAMASGGRVTPDGWGGAAGDRLTWSLVLEGALAHPVLSLRYAFGARRFGHLSARRLAVFVDGRLAGGIAVPDTGGWSLFAVARAPLPPLAAGAHRIAVAPTARDTNADLDALSLGPLPEVVLRSGDGHFALRRSPRATGGDPKAILAGFARIAEAMRAFAGWQPAFPMNVNLVERANWPDPRWAAYSNDDGVFLRAEGAMSDQGNWAHEATHLMFQGRIPRAMDEALVHTLTLGVWMPRVFGDRSGLAAIRAAGEAFREHPDATYDDVRPILLGLADRFGVDLYGRFLRAAGDGPLTVAQFVEGLSKAAGRDLTPDFQRWKGFAVTSPVGRARASAHGSCRRTSSPHPCPLSS